MQIRSAACSELNDGLWFALTGAEVLLTDADDVEGSGAGDDGQTGPVGVESVLFHCGRDKTIRLSNL